MFQNLDKQYPLFKNKRFQFTVLLLASIVIFISGHREVFIRGRFGSGAMIDFVFILTMLWFNWWLFRFRILNYISNKIVISPDAKKKYFALGFLSHFGFITLLTYLFLFLVYNKHIISFFMNEFSASFFLIGSWYLLGFFMHQNSSKEPSGSNRIEIQSGNKVQLLAPEEISLVKTEDLHAVFYLSDGKKFASRDSLDKVMDSLSDHMFFRVNRQLILSVKVIKGFRKIENRKLEIEYEYHTTTGFTIVSRYKASAFKEWFNQACTIQQ